MSSNGTPREQESRVVEGRQCVDHAEIRDRAEKTEKGGLNNTNIESLLLILFVQISSFLSVALYNETMPIGSCLLHFR